MWLYARQHTSVKYGSQYTNLAVRLTVLTLLLKIWFVPLWQKNYVLVP